MKIPLKVFLACFLAAGVSSCSSYIKTYYYLLHTDPAVRKAENPLSLTLEVRNVRAPSYYQDQMVYRQGEYEVGFYEYSQWVESPPVMVKRALVSGLRAAGLFRNVDTFGVVLSSDLILISEILSFDQVIEKEECFAECEVAFELLTSDDPKTIWSYDSKARVKQKGEGEFAAAMSEALRATITQAVEAMEETDSLKELAARKK